MPKVDKGQDAQRDTAPAPHQGNNSHQQERLAVAEEMKTKLCRRREEEKKKGKRGSHTVGALFQNEITRLGSNLTKNKQPPKKGFIGDVKCVLYQGSMCRHHIHTPLNR